MGQIKLLRQLHPPSPEADEEESYPEDEESRGEAQTTAPQDEMNQPLVFYRPLPEASIPIRFLTRCDEYDNYKEGEIAKASPDKHDPLERAAPAGRRDGGPNQHRHRGDQQGCQAEIEECPCFNDHGASQFDNTTQLPVP